MTTATHSPVRSPQTFEADIQWADAREDETTAIQTMLTALESIGVTAEQPIQVMTAPQAFGYSFSFRLMEKLLMQHGGMWEFIDDIFTVTV